MSVVGEAKSTMCPEVELVVFEVEFSNSYMRYSQTCGAVRNTVAWCQLRGMSNGHGA